MCFLDGFLIRNHARTSTNTEKLKKKIKAKFLPLLIFCMATRGSLQCSYGDHSVYIL